MPLLDIATAQPYFQSHAHTTLRAQGPSHCKCIFSNENTLASVWKPFQIPSKAKNFNSRPIEMQRGGLVIRAVATLEPKCLLQSKNGHKDNCNSQLDIDSRSSSVIQPQSLTDDSEELNEREKLRRMRISKANKGNVPWNKGRKHSPETIQRIKERTRLAMQDQKVKMKLINLGHAQSEETRLKIGIGVRMGWERRRKKLMLQETCHFEWQNLLAEASRKGFLGEEELQWDSYKILDEQLEREWLESVEQRKKMPRTKGSKRAPKSPEQRRKISEAISAKWADPGYRDRVCSALSKYHGTPVGVERKRRRRPSGDRQPRKKATPKEKAIDVYDSVGKENKTQNPRSRLKRSGVPLYKDPFASSKLQMIKNIRAQRAAAETKKTEAIERAKLLIAEAEKAAKALEVAAMQSPLAQASLIETRKLIAEAIQSIESIDAGCVASIDTTQANSSENSTRPSFGHLEKEKDAEIEGPGQADNIKINGTQTSETSGNVTNNRNFGKFTLQDLVNGKNGVLPTGSNGYGVLRNDKAHQGGSSDYGFASTDVESMMQSSFTEELGELEQRGDAKEEKIPLPDGSKIDSSKEEMPPNPITGTKKWVCGRLVEVAEAD